MQELEVTFGRAAQVWWAWFWRSTLFALLASSVVGFTFGFIRASLGFHGSALPVSFTLGAVVGVLVSILVLAKVLKMKFSSFRLVLVQE